ncbi:MAG TPA: 1-(5-phosphoribosyl)-5-[(5-phosphoribosylamino)methylideneamino]imidazole-4-carboxamide isomerase [Sedimentisphaerales bacterium]|nr:1-(5-phosphoribosyl)-5-[(5-phosphoribosylamino)methylideneamino]imidazole-4-carboxamide isomerase [Sedimentisphaerales bacterium]HRS12381.1 1-(5-phosphoribosyl)-5-[(5-phosphoribosylamino)methylideneamino]imidazole-4-carboxamide isomerase [Sedimentisphaerales bacterium]HRV48921.1 1-(5-phosphoribosyl)-5-[(5-phosphoribosylamino)methylideneamino]imidazole-4-carboxamide isomerase [Sedimentisphaerales bacterium]
MDVIPAIDLRDGKVVRLIQGQYDKQITYRDDPAEQARQFHADGARWLHIVDLDGAKAGRPVNTASIEAIARLGLLKIEVGGGLRDESSIAQLIEMGVTRVIIGTKAVSDFDWFCRTARKFAGRVVLGLDARGSMVATHGWLEDSKQTVLEFAARADELPLAAIIYTDIAKDGMLTGPNIERTKALVQAVKTPVIASGGVKEVDDIRRLHPIGVAGVIVGRSLYEGTLTLKDAIAAAR